MSQQYDVVMKSGRVVKNGERLTLEDAKTVALAFAKRNGYQPKVSLVERTASVSHEQVAEEQLNEQLDTQEQAPAGNTVGVATIAVAQARITCRMGRYIWRHQRAIQDKTVRARNDNQMEKFHWSGILSMAMNNAEIMGKRLEFLNEKFSQVKSAVEAHDSMGSTYTILNPDEARFYFGK